MGVKWRSNRSCKHRLTVFVSVDGDAAAGDDDVNSKVHATSADRRSACVCVFVCGRAAVQR